MNYSLYQAADFATDESFIAYYLKTDESAIGFWEEWISHHPEKIDEILNAEQILALMNLHLPEDEFQMESNRFENFLTANQPNRISKTKEFEYKRYTKFAALIAPVIIVICIIFYFYPTNEPLTYVTRQNGYGKISTFYLSDGTKVTLNANSSLKLPKVFSSKKRLVFLNGEAFFEVAKDKSKPFVVEANGTKTTVLGTKFNVSAYRNSSDTKIALIEGSVELSANAERDKMVLRPSEMAIFSIKHKILMRAAFDIDEVSSWKNGDIVFNNATFQDIADKLKNSYGIVLINESGKRDWHYSGKFKKTDYISIITSICFVENISFEQTHQTVKLKPKK